MHYAAMAAEKLVHLAREKLLAAAAYDRVAAAGDLLIAIGGSAWCPSV
jgi:hypothetical protein